MSLFRKHDKHNEDLVDEISDSFNRAIKRKRDGDTSHEKDEKTAAPRFTVTGDKRVPPKPPRETR